MCGIWFVDDKVDNLENADLIKHRGPDNTSVHKGNSSTFVFHRLAINDVSSKGDQPFVIDDTVFMCNGEIYNHKELETHFEIATESNSDCEVIANLIHQGVPTTKICNNIDGVFAFVAKSANQVIAARDPIGVRPLYFGYNENKKVCFSSEMKGLTNVCSDVKEFPPGHYMVNSILFSYYNITISPAVYSCCTLRNTLTSAVSKRLVSDRPVGFFLSGGLDSSLIASLGASMNRCEQIQTFSIGIGDSPDLKCAKKVADYINSNHTEIRFTIEDGINAIHQVIKSLETYDCTTIRASVPMYLLSKYVSNNTDIKVILSGEGADELFGGYLYFHYAPDMTSFHNETVRLLQNVHVHDVLRADRCTAAHGLELRVPFFDRTLIDYVSNIYPAFKMPKQNKIEKQILRESFNGYLPDDILWRQKNGMSDAVGHSWVDAIKQHCANIKQEVAYNKNPPLSNEEYFYRTIYHHHFGTTDNVKSIWRPQWTNETDPSASLLDIFTQ